MIDSQFLDGLERFNLIVRKRVTSNFAGERRSVMEGRGMLFKDHRIYAPGDDFRAIDWKVFARTDDLMLKNYEEDKNLSVHILVDSSLSMKFGKPSKFDYASMIGVGYAYLAMKNNDKFQFSTFSDDIDVFQPHKGLSQVMAMIDYLNGLKLKGKTDLVASLQKYKRFIGSRSMIIVVSDFLMPFEEIKEALNYFGKSDIHLIQVLDPVERNLELSGDYKLSDAESTDVLRTYISPQLQEKYRKKLDDHIAKIRQECLVSGVDFVSITTDLPIFDAFYEVLK